MKRTFLILACLIAVISSFAQTEIGIKAGFTRNRFWGSEYYQKYHDAVSGFSLGAVVNKVISNHFSLSTGLHFERTGSGIDHLYFEDTTAANYIKGRIAVQTNYLQVPLTATYSFGKSRAFGLTGGIFGGYLLSAKYKYHYESDTYLPGERSNKDDYKDFNFGLVAAVNYRLNLSENKSLVFSVEDHWGLSQISQLEGDKMKTNNVGVYASFIMTVKERNIKNSNKF